MRKVHTFIVISSVVLAATSITSSFKATTQNNRTASQLYSQYCVDCHGKDGRSKTSKGKYSHARDLTDAKWQEDVSDARIFNSIMNGRSVRGNMPAFNDQLKEKEVESLVDLVRKFKR